MIASDDAGWISRCIARVLEVDPVVEVSLLTPIVEDMADNPSWRDQDPEVLMEKMLGPVDNSRPCNPKDTEWDLDGVNPNLRPSATGPEKKT